MFKKVAILFFFAIMLPIESLAAETVTTIVNNVPVQASYDSLRVIDLIPLGETVNKLEQNGQYYKIQYGNVTGWINIDYTNERGSYQGPTISLSSNSEFLDVARARKQYVYNEGFYYQQARLYCPLRPTTSRTVDCSTYVCDVLYHYGQLRGLPGLQEMGRFSTRIYKAIGRGLATGQPTYHKNVELTQYFSLVPSFSQAQPGDILLVDGHIEIYAGNNTCYSCGSTAQIQAPGLVTAIDSRPIIYIFRVK